MTLGSPRRGTPLFICSWLLETMLKLIFQDPEYPVGASMRRLVHIIYGVLKSGTYFNAEIPMRELAIQDGI